MEEDRVYPAVEHRMRFVIELPRSNIRHQIGGFSGPRSSSGRRADCSAGVNLLMSLDCSVFHAEMAAIILAQQIIGDFDLGGPGRPPYELVASTEPCAMCLDATRWSGVRHPVRGARDGDAERLGFDEGTKPAEWVPALERRGITWSATYYATRPPRCFGNLPGAEGEVYDAR